MEDIAVIWTTSLVLAACALAWMLWLILARLLRERSDTARLRDRKLIQQVYLDIMNGSGDAVVRLRNLKSRAALMAEALLEATSLVRGGERDRLISALRVLSIDELFREQLFRGRAAERIAAADALSIFASEETTAALRRALAVAPSGELRVGLMRALIDVGAPPPIDMVLEDLKGRKATESLLYLPLIRSLVAADPMSGLHAFGDEEVSADARAIVAEALGASGDFRVLAPLLLAGRAPDIELRIAVLRGLTALGHPAAEPCVLRGLSEDVWMIRAAACEAAGRIGLRSAAPRLAELLGDPTWWVRFRAGEALAVLGGAGVDQLRAVAVAGDDLSRRTASMALAERGLVVEAA